MTKQNKNGSSGQKNSSAHDYPIKIFTNIQENIENIKQLLKSPADLITRDFTAGSTDHPIAVIYIDGLVDKTLINEHIIRSIHQIPIYQNQGGTNDHMPARHVEHRNSPRRRRSTHGQNLLNLLQSEILSVNEVNVEETLDKVVLGILSGNTALFVDGTDQVLMVETRGWAERAVQEPFTEVLIRGPRDGFNENIVTNMAHIRRDIRDPNLRMESRKIGRRSKKDLVIAYIEGIVHPQILKELRRRLDTFDMDSAPESGYIEQWIEDSFLSPFPTLHHTERPDKVASALFNGKIAILLDGTPFVLLLPITFGSLMQSPEDYYERWMVGTLLRLLRYTAAFCAVFLPSLYIALVSFHPGMIPSKLAFSIAATREGLPFPSAIEAFTMITVLEILREAGIRLPKPIGQTVGIVGGLVIGEAAVSAGIVSPIMVIVVALTAICSFSVPNYSLAISFRMIVYGMMIAAAAFGLFGLVMGYIMLNIHIVNLKSFGIPYSTPFAPSFYQDWKDLVLRMPYVMMRKRPQMMQTSDKQKASKGGNMT